MTLEKINDPWVIKFRDEALPLIKEKFNPEKVIIFGSRAKDNSNAESDLDVIIVAEIFKSIPFVKRYNTIFGIIKIPIHIDYICYTPEEFQEIQTQSVIIHDALSGPVIAMV